MMGREKATEAQVVVAADRAWARHVSGDGDDEVWERLALTPLLQRMGWTLAEYKSLEAAQYAAEEEMYEKARCDALRWMGA